MILQSVSPGHLKEVKRSEVCRHKPYDKLSKKLPVKIVNLQYGDVNKEISMVKKNITLILFNVLLLIFIMILTD